MGIKEYVKGIEDIESVKTAEFEVLFNEGLNFIIKRTEKNNESILAFIPSEGQFYIKNIKKGEVYIGDTLTKNRVTRFMKNFDITLENEWLDINSKYFFEKVFPEIMINKIYQIAIKNGIKARSFLIETSGKYEFLHTTESEILHRFVDIAVGLPIEEVEKITPKIFLILKKAQWLSPTLIELIEKNKMDFFEKIYELAKNDELIPTSFRININMDNVDFFEILLKRTMETKIMRDWIYFEFDEKEYFDLSLSEAIRKVTDRMEREQMLLNKIKENTLERNYKKIYENEDLHCEIYLRYGMPFISYNGFLYLLDTKNMDNIIKEKACCQTIVEFLKEKGSNYCIKKYNAYIEFFR